MTSSPCSAGERPSRRALWRPKAWAVVLAAIPFTILTATLLGQPATGPIAEVGLRAPVCPTYKNFCVNAQRTGVFDLKTGVAELEGEVIGYVESQDMTFRSDLLRAFRNDDGDWKRLLLTTNVRMSQPDRKLTADHGVIEEETALFYGTAKMTDDTAISESDEIYLEHETNKATLKGSPQNPVRMEYTAPPKEEDADLAPGVPPQKPPQPTKSRSQKAVVEEDNHQVTLTGQVNVDMPDEQMLMNAESVTLQFGDDNSVIGFQARGDVVIVQPGRRLTADSARSQNRMQSVLLQGRARAQQQGQFDLASDRMEVYTDPKKGSVRSEDRQRPINLSVDLKSNKPYKLLETKFQALVDQGVPPDTLEKLRPILEKSYGTQDAFRKDASDLLTAEEAQRYMSLILVQAH